MFQLAIKFQCRDRSWTEFINCYHLTLNNTKQENNVPTQASENILWIKWFIKLRRSAKQT